MSWSIVSFTGREMIRLAVAIEEAGRSFYEKAGLKVGDAGVRSIFSYLAGEEEKHIADFKKLGDGLTEDVNINESYVGEYGDYLKSIIDSHVFNVNNVDDLVNGVKTPGEALAIAFRFEKDSIVIFQEFGHVVDQAGRPVIEELVRQEKEHIRKLAEVSRTV